MDYQGENVDYQMLNPFNSAPRPNQWSQLPQNYPQMPPPNPRLSRPRGPYVGYVQPQGAAQDFQPDAQMSYQPFNPFARPPPQPEEMQYANPYYAAPEQPPFLPPPPPRQFQMPPPLYHHFAPQPFQGGNRREARLNMPGPPVYNGPPGMVPRPFLPRLGVRPPFPAPPGAWIANPPDLDYIPRLGGMPHRFRPPMFGPMDDPEIFHQPPPGPEGGICPICFTEVSERCKR